MQTLETAGARAFQTLICIANTIHKAATPISGVKKRLHRNVFTVFRVEIVWAM